MIGRQGKGFVLLHGLGHEVEWREAHLSLHTAVAIVIHPRVGDDTGGLDDGTDVVHNSFVGGSVGERLGLRSKQPPTRLRAKPATDDIKLSRELVST